MELLTVEEIAALLRVSTVTVRRYIKSGRLAVVRVGRNVRVDREAVEDLLRIGLPAEQGETQLPPGRGVLNDAPVDVLDRYHVSSEDSWVMDMGQVLVRNQSEAWLEAQIANGIGVLTAGNPIWKHIGMFNGPGQPDDVSEHKAKYLAEAYTAKDE